MVHDGARWAGRHAGKDALRDEIWSGLERGGIAVGTVRNRIPEVVGAELAADRLFGMPEWAAAAVIKCNPDRAQIAVRRRALGDGKTVYVPVPELGAGVPFLRLDPEALRRKGVLFDHAATSRGALAHGDPVTFEDLPVLPISIVGCVAVTRRGARIGKGGGFADLELGIFRALGKVDGRTLVATTVHSSQVVAEGRITMERHDSVLDVIATERELICTGAAHVDPGGIDWDRVRADQWAAIPVLTTLRDRSGRH